MRQAVTVLSQLKKDEDGATLTKYTAALIAILICDLGRSRGRLWISDSGKQPRSAGSM